MRVTANPSQPTFEEALRFFGVQKFRSVASPLEMPLRPGYWVATAEIFRSHKILNFETSETPYFSGIVMAKFWCGQIAIRSNLRLAGRNPCADCADVYARIGLTTARR